MSDEDIGKVYSLEMENTQLKLEVRDLKQKIENAVILLKRAEIAETGDDLLYLTMSALDSLVIV